MASNQAETLQGFANRVMASAVVSTCAMSAVQRKKAVNLAARVIESPPDSIQEACLSTELLILLQEVTDQVKKGVS